MNTITIIATICAYLIKGLCGFANTLVFGTVLSFSTNNINITPLELIVGYPTNIYIAFKERKNISIKVFLPLSVLVILGSIPGALFLKNIDAAIIRNLFGFAVILIGLEMLLREKYTVNKKNSSTVLIIIGVISGLLCGLFGIGAFLVAYISRTTTNQNEFKGNLCIVFFIENTFRIILYSLTGILKIEIVKEAFTLIPFMIVGLTAGLLLSEKISEKNVKNTIILFLILSGIALIIK